MSLAHQFLFGYDNGHRLLAGSRTLPASVLVRLLAATDAAMGPSCPALVTGLALSDTHEFALCVTWSAPELPRSGAVWSHALIVEGSQLRDPCALEALLRLPRRPFNRSIEGYAEPLELDVQTAPVASYLPPGKPAPELLRSIAAATYRGRGAPVVTHEDLGEAALALVYLWAAQWPELRARFSFRTREVAGAESSEADITVTAGVRGSVDTENGAPSAEERAWLNAIVEDARSATATPFGDFLWEFGPLEPPEPSCLRRLASLWARVADGDARSACGYLERHWPGECGAALKQALFGRGENTWWAVGERERVVALLGGDRSAWGANGLALAERIRGLNKAP